MSEHDELEMQIGGQTWTLPHWPDVRNLREYQCSNCGHKYKSLHIIHCPVDGCECFCGGYLPEQPDESRV